MIDSEQLPDGPPRGSCSMGVRARLGIVEGFSVGLIGVLSVGRILAFELLGESWLPT